MRVTNKELLVNGDMSGDLLSDPQQLEQQFGYSIQANYPTSGTLAGTLSLECSNDYEKDGNGNILSAGNWVQIADSTKVISESDSPTAYVWNVTDVYYRWVRVKYVTHSSDTGLLTIYFNGHGF